MNLPTPPDSPASTAAWPITIRISWLRERRACKDQVAAVQAEWGESHELTRDTMIRAAELRLDLGWLAEQLLARRPLQLYLADCAERVLHIYEANHPNETAPQELIAAIRADAPQPEIDALCERAVEAARAAGAAGPAWAGWAAVAAGTGWAAVAAGAGEALRAVEAARMAREARAIEAAWAGWAAAEAERTARAAGAAEVAGAAERKWQAERLFEYLAGEVEVAI